MGPDEILGLEPAEAIEKIQLALKTCNAYISLFNQKRQNLKSYFKEGNGYIAWDFASDMIFSRLNRFIEKLDTLQGFINTVIELLKLEKIEIGGLKGRALSEEVLALFEGFSNMYSEFQSRGYDTISLENDEFEQAYDKFSQAVMDIDKKLASIACLAFDECSNCDQAYKLILILGSLVERKEIKSHFQCKYPILIEMFMKDLNTCKLIFDAMTSRPEGPILHKNMPPVSGALRWAQDLRERISSSMNNIRALNHGRQDLPEVVLVTAKYEEMSQLIDK